MPASKPVRPRAPQPPPPEVVDPRWILKAAGAVVALGLLCSYLTLCLFFYSAQWQFVLHPSHTLAGTPAAEGLRFTPVRFGDDASGQPQLSGWWIRSNSPADPTALVLHSETGSMAEALPLAKALHNARLNVFLFDYHGYGQSAGRHPTEKLMQNDADQALLFLTRTRNLPASQIVVFGQGLGASLATGLCRQTPEIPALVLVDADGDTLSRVEADQRSRMVPITLLFHERFPLADALHILPTPKLFISYTNGAAPLVAQRAADPKMTTELPPNSGAEALTAAILRFLGTYMVSPVPALPAPR